MKVGIIRPEGVETFGWISQNYEIIRSPLGAVWIQISTDGAGQIPPPPEPQTPLVFDPVLGEGTVMQLEEQLAEHPELIEDASEDEQN